MPKFNVGDRVVWRSQAQGSFVEKRGVVFYVVPPGERMDRSKALYHLRVQYAENATWRADFGGMARKEESYLVAIPGTDRKLPVVYWPRTSALREDTDV